MARDLLIQVANNEDIISFECNYINKTARILVGVGTLDKKGDFTPQPEQVYQVYNFTEEKFDQLMGFLGNKVITNKDDLWSSIDEKRVELKNLKAAEEAIFSKKA